MRFKAGQSWGAWAAEPPDGRTAAPHMIEALGNKQPGFQGDAIHRSEAYHRRGHAGTLISLPMPLGLKWSILGTGCCYAAPKGPATWGFAPYPNIRLQGHSRSAVLDAMPPRTRT
jgi:hypothetical protein